MQDVEENCTERKNGWGFEKEEMIVVFWNIGGLGNAGRRGILKLDFEKAYDKVQWSFVEEVMRLKKIPWKVDFLGKTVNRRRESGNKH